MNVNRIASNKGHTFAFEIENAYICPSKIADIISTIEGVSSVRLRKRFSSEKELHVKFSFHGNEFIVWEPYGDSSRYWIGPAGQLELDNDIEPLIKVFESYRPPFMRRVLGDVMTLNFRVLFR